MVKIIIESFTFVDNLIKTFLPKYIEANSIGAKTIVHFSISILENWFSLKRTKLATAKNTSV